MNLQQTSRYIVFQGTLLMILTVLFAIIGFLSIVFFGYAFYPWKRPLPTESDYSHKRSPWWQLYYSSKYVNSIKKAEKNSRLESYFQNIQSPHYDSTLSQSTHISLKFVGDLMMRKDLVTPSSRHLWDHIEEYLFDADFVMGNLEFALNPSWHIEKLLRFSVPYHYADPFFKEPRGKFHCVSLGNNHCNDSLSQGIVSTGDYLDAIGMTHTGANRCIEEVDSFPIINVNGISIALLSYTFSTNNIPLDSDFSFGLNVIRFNALRDQDYDPSLILHHIQLAKQRGAQIIISAHHWGIEFEYYPPSRLIKRAHELMDAGIDIIVGHHPHILNPSEWYHTKDGRTALCLYSLGNFTSWGLLRPMQKLAQIAQVTVESGTDNQGKQVVRLKEATLTPTYFLMSGKKEHADHRIIPLLKTNTLIRRGKRPSYIPWHQALLLKSVEKEYRKYFFQSSAFRYD